MEENNLVGENFREACFVKIGCGTCQKYREYAFLYWKQPYVICKDIFLSMTEKINKLKLRERN